MAEMANQMLEARAQLKHILLSAGPFLLGVLGLMLAIELWQWPGVPFMTFGCLVGCVYAALNIVMLFWFMAPYFFRQEKGGYFGLGLLVSLTLGGILMYSATRMGTLWAIGLAFGIASPAFIGTLHSLKVLATTSKS